VNVPSPIVLTLEQLSSGEDSERRCDALPASPGIYCLRLAGGPPHVARCVNLRKRLRRILFPSQGRTENPSTAFRGRLQQIECWPTGSKLETSLVLYAITKELFPDSYPRRLRLRTPWFLGLTAADAFPRLAFVNRLPRRHGPLYGPFASRDLAQIYEEQVAGLFQIRRCPEILAPSFDHPGCIYGEMNQCLRPCQRAVTAEEYGAEAMRVAEFLATNGRSTLAALSVEREAASEALDFERAALLHKRIERVKGAMAARDPVVADISQFNGIALTRSNQESRFCLWPMRDGLWSDPLRIEFSPEQPRTRSLDAALREDLTAALAANPGPGRRVEHLALFLRWHRSSWRDGEWFPFRTLGDLNYRKLVREISKLAKNNSQSC
jgi:excinuclease ABC subunit C